MEKQDRSDRLMKIVYGEGWNDGFKAALFSMGGVGLIYWIVRGFLYA